MEVMMIVEGSDCALRIEPEDEEGEALLASFGVKGHFQTKLGPTSPPTSLSAARVVASCESMPVEVG